MKDKRLELLPEDYRNTIFSVIEDAKEIYGTNLNSLFLAGSTGKGNCIPGWSDIDMYIITNEIDFEKNMEFYKKSKDYKIHVGTTFYTVDMVDSLNVDQKTKVAFYEYYNYNVNYLVYGDKEIPNVGFEELVSSEKSLDDSIQVVERELYNYEIDGKNFKTLVKKVTLLMKVYLRIFHQSFVFGYSNVFEMFNSCEKLDANYDINNIILTGDSEKQFSNIVKTILCVIMEGRKMENEKDLCKRISSNRKGSICNL